MSSGKGPWRRRGSPPPGRSILMTSAPKPARILVQYAPATPSERSSTRRTESEVIRGLVTDLEIVRGDELVANIVRDVVVAGDPRIAVGQVSPFVGADGAIARGRVAIGIVHLHGEVIAFAWGDELVPGG